MAKRKTDIWMPLFIGDYIADTIGFSLEEHGGYLLSIMAYWRKGGALSDSEMQGICNRVSNRVCDRYVKESVDGVVFWRHSRIDKELKDAECQKHANIAKTEKARQRRWSVTDSVTESVTESVTVSVTETPSPSPSHIINKDISVSGDTPPQPQPPNPTTRPPLKEANGKKPRRQIEYTPEFERFWEIYPRRNGKVCGKEAAFFEWQKLLPEEFTTVIQNAKNYGVGNDFPKDPERFLKKSFWRDWNTPMTSKKQDSVSAIPEGI